MSPKIYWYLVDIYIYIDINIYIYLIYIRYDMILYCILGKYIESRPADIKYYLVAIRNTAKLWAIHGYTHVIAKLSDQTPVLATSKSGPVLKPYIQLGYKIFINRKGAIIRDNNNLPSSCKANTVPMDHMKFHFCFITPSIPIAPNIYFSVSPPIYVTRQTRSQIYIIY